MTQVDDLSRSLIAFEQNSTMVVVLEMSQSSWLAAGVVPGIERRPLKKLDPDPSALLRLVEGWRDHAMKVGRMITRRPHGSIAKPTAPPCKFATTDAEVTPSRKFFRGRDGL